MAASSKVKQFFIFSLILILFNLVTAVPADLGCHGGGRGSRVPLNMARIDKKCRALPHDHPFKFERDGVDFYNFAAMQMNLLQTPELALPDDQWVAALGSNIDTRGRVIANSTAYIALRPSSKAQFFRLYSLKFFCMKNGSPTSCTLGYRISRTTDLDFNDPKNATLGEYVAAAPSTFGQLYFPASADLRFMSLGASNAENQNATHISMSDVTIPDSEWSNGITAYVFDVQYSTPKCSKRTPKTDDLTSVMGRFATGC